GTLEGRSTYEAEAPKVDPHNKQVTPWTCQTSRRSRQPHDFVLCLSPGCGRQDQEVWCSRCQG
ncbi:hypothetical protein FRC05_007329, partial [Tulasnella sp. 425]